MTSFYFICIVVYCNFLTYGESGDVLFIPAMISNSHKIAMVIWADALAEKGHVIHWWAPAPKLDNYQPKNLTMAHVDHFLVDADDQFLMDAMRHGNSSDMDVMVWQEQKQMPFIETFLSHMIEPFCESVLKKHKQSFDKILAKKYDLIIIDEFFNPCGFLLTNLLVKKSSAPVMVYVSTCRWTRRSSTFNGVPTPYSHVPHMGSLSALSDTLSFYHRIQTVLTYWTGHVVDYILNFMMTRRINKAYTDSYNLKNYQMEFIKSGLIRPNVQLICMPSFLDFPQPLARNQAYIGGIQIPFSFNNPESKKCMAELENKIKSARNGFILIAMGHWANFNHAPKSIKSGFLEAVNQMANEGYVIVWQYFGSHVDNLHKNIMLKEWIPQKALLSHPSCKLFVTHAGCNSLTESLYYGVPMVGIPLFADQGDGVARIVKKGFGTMIFKYNITAESLYNAMTTVLSNESYSKNVKKYSDLMKNEILSPVDRAVYWSEFVMRHGQSEKGAEFYKNSRFAVNQSSFRIYCFDVYLTFVSILICSLFILCKLVCLSFVYINNNNEHKKK